MREGRPYLSGGFRPWEITPTASSAPLAAAARPGVPRPDFTLLGPKSASSKGQLEPEAKAEAPGALLVLGTRGCPRREGAPGKRGLEHQQPARPGARSSTCAPGWSEGSARGGGPCTSRRPG